MVSIRQVFAYGWIAGLALLAGWFFTLPAEYRRTGAATQTISNLKVISLSMHAYHDKYKHLPPAYALGADGKPAHSWRVLLLEFLGQEALLKQYDFNEPWDGPNNRKLADKMPSQYRVASGPNAQSKLTSYVVLVGPKTAFPGDKAVKFKDITDGLNKTILVAEAEGFNIHWMEPRDWDTGAFPIEISDVKKPGFSSHNRGGPCIALADCIIMRLDFSAPVDQLVRMSTIPGGGGSESQIGRGEMKRAKKRDRSGKGPQMREGRQKRGQNLIQVMRYCQRCTLWSKDMKPQSAAITFAKLRLCGDHLVPDEITKLLGRAPSYSAVAGEMEFQTAVPIRTFITGVWDLETLGRVNSESAEDHVQWLIDFLDDAHHVAIQLPGVDEAEIWCSWRSKPAAGGGGPSFSATILEDLSRHGLILTVDLLSAGFTGNPFNPPS